MRRPDATTHARPCACLPARCAGAVAAAASRSSSQPAGRPIGAIRATSGVPPRFDFSGSENVKMRDGALSGAASCPDGAASTIGYKARVVLPARRCAEGCRQAGDAASSSSTTRCARSSACRPKRSADADAVLARRERSMRRRPSRRPRRVPKQRDRSRRARPCDPRSVTRGGGQACWSMCRPAAPAGRADAVRRGPTRGMGAADPEARARAHRRAAAFRLRSRRAAARRRPDRATFELTSHGGRSSARMSRPRLTPRGR